MKLLLLTGFIMTELRPLKAIIPVLISSRHTTRVNIRSEGGPEGREESREERARNCYDAFYIIGTYGKKYR